jgi:hypothetical protein
LTELIKTRYILSNQYPVPTEGATIMNPELTASLVAQHTRELTAQADAERVAQIAVPRPRSGRRVAPGYHVSWSRVSLALSEGGRPRTSWAIVISGTRSR